MRIAIVNDLIIATEALRRVVTAASHKVAWTAVNGVEAVRRCAEDRPDVILMDLLMPEMDGVEATRRIMAATPCAILIVTSDLAGRYGRVFEALGAGALDAVNTPMLAGANGEGQAQALVTKIATIGRLIGGGGGTAVPFVERAGPGTARPGQWLFAIGASAGGPAAVAEVLKTFPANTPASFVVIQHLDAHFAVGLREWLAQQITLPVRIARDGDSPEAGVVLLPGRDDHLVFTPRGTLAYTADPVQYVYRPSVDAMFESIAAHWRQNAVGVLLTGMGRDGARGLKKMREAKFPTIAQDRASSAVYGMPKAAAEAGAASQILPLSRIGAVLREFL